MNNRHQAWNNWQKQNQGRINNFHNNQEQRWNHLESARGDRQNWRDQNREDWQKHREELWDYRAGRACEIWDNERDYCDNIFDDHWWGACGWGPGWVENYPVDPWWWWASASYPAVATFVEGVSSEPVYIDYGMNVDYEGSTVYVDDQPIPTAQYSQPLTSAAAKTPQPPPPTPPAPGQQAEWMPLGVFALAQEEKGDPTMFFQLSVNREGVISGAYNNTLSGDQHPVTGKLDKASQRVAWRIGDKTQTIYETSLANLTLDVSPVTVHLGDSRTQTWLLVRMPEPAQANAAAKLPEISQKPPPLAKATTKPAK